MGFKTIICKKEDVKVEVYYSNQHTFPVYQGSEIMLRTARADFKLYFNGDIIFCSEGRNGCAFFDHMDGGGCHVEEQGMIILKIIFKS